MTPPQKPGRSRQDYGTPPEFLAAVKQRLGIEDFDCDLAANADNRVTRPYLSLHNSAFDAPLWLFGDGWNWLNPPFAKIGPWVKRAHEEAEASYNACTAVLIPAAVGSVWWHEWVHHKANVVFFSPRLTFIGTPINPKTGRPDVYPKDCALLLYGNGRLEYDVWRWKPSTPRAAEIPMSNGTAGESAARKDH